MDSIGNESLFSIPLSSEDQTEEIRIAEAASKRALKQIQMLYNEIMEPKSSDIELDSVRFNQLSNRTSLSSVSSHDSNNEKRCFHCRNSKTVTSSRSSCSNSSISSSSSTHKNSSVCHQNNSSRQKCRNLTEKFNVTVPKPFSITGENERRLKAKEQKINKLKEELNNEMEKELNVKVCVKPVPKHVHSSLYSEMVLKDEKRKQERKNMCQMVMQKQIKSFNLSTSALRSKSTSDLSKKDLNTNFKARPIPKGILSENISKKMHKKEEIRKFLIAQRAEETLKQSSLPFTPKHISRSYSTLDLNFYKKYDNVKVPKPNISAITKRLYTLKCQETMESWNNKVLEHSNSKHKDCFLTENNCVQNVSLKKKYLEEPLPFYNIPVRMSTASMLRDRLIRKQIHSREKRQETSEEIGKEFELKRKEITKNIWSTLKAMEVSKVNSEKEIEEKVKNFRESQRNREREYTKELEEMMDRVSHQYLLIERQTKINEKAAPSIETANKRKGSMSTASECDEEESPRSMKSEHKSTASREKPSASSTSLSKHNSSARSMSQKSEDEASVSLSTDPSS